MNKRIYILSIEHPIEGLVLRALFAAVGLLALSYIYLVGASILNVIEHKEATAQAHALEGVIAALERDYFALSESISPESGTVLGLKPTSDVAYIYRPGSVGQAEAVNRGI